MRVGAPGAAVGAGVGAVAPVADVQVVPEYRGGGVHAPVVQRVVAHSSKLLDVPGMADGMLDACDTVDVEAAAENVPAGTSSAAAAVRATRSFDRMISPL